MSKMLMIRAIVRPEKVDTILSELMDAGFPSVTKIDVAGRGKQRGVKIGDVIYNELPKELLLMVVNFIGIKNTCETLRQMAQFFSDMDLIKRTEELIAREKNIIEPIINKYKPGITGRTAMLYVGGSRSHHYGDIFRELGVETIMAGYEFAHRDDYEGRQALPTIKVDADSKNIEELDVKPDESRFKPISEEKAEDLKKSGILLNEYEGLFPSLPEGALIVDDLNHYETEELIKKLKPDIFCSGIKDKYYIQKMGVPSKQLHSYDYSGPYAGFRGAAIFAYDIYMSFNNPSWQYIKPPWEKEPEIVGDLILK